MTPLQLMVTAVHKGASAHFEVLSEAPGIYEVELVSYDGRKSQSPPAQFMMLRGIVSWSGSIDDKILLNNIGAQVELHLSRMLSKDPAKQMEQY